LPKIKLTHADVAGIRYAAAEGASSAALAVIYNVSRIQIWRILKGQQHKGIQALRAESLVQKRVNDANRTIVDLLRKTGGL